MQISESIRELYRRLIAIERHTEAQSQELETIKVDAVVGKLAYFYEKLRNTMDYQEDHLLRRYAIERTIKRRVVLESFKPKIAKTLIEELIRAGYLPNGKISESIIEPIAVIINKYEYLLGLIHDEIKDAKLRRDVSAWAMSIAACEIDLIIAPEDRADALIESLHVLVKDRIKFKGAEISGRERNIQLYITLHKELVRSDNAIISYHLLNLYFPEWKNADRKLVEFVGQKITSVYHGIEAHLNNPIRLKIARSLKRQIVAFKVLRELVTTHHNNLVELFANPEFFDSEAKKVIEKTYRTTRKRLRSASLRAVIYIFITKIGLAFLLEYPYDVYIAGHVNFVALYINILFPPILMFLVTLSARLPGSSNTASILDELRKMVYGNHGDEFLCELNIKRRHGSLAYFFEYLFYILLYGIIFGFMIYVLRRLEFNLLSGAIFLFFVTAVSFFGSRIRQSATEYAVEARREGVLSLVIIFLSLPIIRAGHWLSLNLKRINLLTFILDFIIEAPFKVLVELIEGWFAFLREKREDTYKN